MNAEIAGYDDIPVLSCHHRKMFEEIWQKKGLPLEESRAMELEKAYAEKLGIQFRDGSCIAWIVRENKLVVASGAISMAVLAPVPDDMNPKVAFLHSMYTDKDFRRRGYARLIIESAVAHCKEKAIVRMLLNASEDGRPLYESLGFSLSGEAMRLFIK